MHHLERYTSPEWPALASHNRRSAPHASGPRKRPGNSLHSKCARNGTSQTAGATLAGAPPTARLSKCTISSVTRAWSGMTTLKPQQRSSTHMLEHAQTHHGIPLHTKDACNSTSDISALQNYQPDYQPDYQLRADSSNYRADSSNYQADSTNYQPPVGPGRLIIQLSV